MLSPALPCTLNSREGSREGWPRKRRADIVALDERGLQAARRIASPSRGQETASHVMVMLFLGLYGDAIGLAAC